ncbi:hypothetical protein [Streptomyces sp. B21-083]|uniref:hypothetical protein n=1 Tax=Streptomyces sp. B21-083 TaxID=3039410 RepID=UPI002FEF5C6B
MSIDDNGVEYAPAARQDDPEPGPEGAQAATTCFAKMWRQALGEWHSRHPDRGPARREPAEMCVRKGTSHPIHPIY